MIEFPRILGAVVLGLFAKKQTHFINASFAHFSHKKKKKVESMGKMLCLSCEERKNKPSTRASLARGLLWLIHTPKKIYFFVHFSAHLVFFFVFFFIISNVRKFVFVAAFCVRLFSSFSARFHPREAEALGSSLSERSLICHGG